MKFSFHFSVIALLFFVTSISKAQVANYNVGDVVDDFTVTDLDGNVWNLYTLTSQGKYIYLDFFFDTCVPCQLTQPIFNEVYDKYGCNSGELFLISINNGSDTDAEIITFMDEYGGPFNHSPAVGINGGCEAVTDNFGIVGYPSYLLINPDNVFLGRLEGTVGDITIEAFENSFPKDFDPPPMQCNLGASDTTSTFQFNIYPNPSGENYINLFVNDIHINSVVIIYNTLGQAVYIQSIEQSKTVLEHNLPMGNYFVQLTSQNGVFTKKLMVK